MHNICASGHKTQSSVVSCVAVSWLFAFVLSARLDGFGGLRRHTDAPPAGSETSPLKHGPEATKHDSDVGGLLKKAPSSKKAPEANGTILTWAGSLKNATASK